MAYLKAYSNRLLVIFGFAFDHFSYFFPSLSCPASTSFPYLYESKKLTHLAGGVVAVLVGHFHDFFGPIRAKAQAAQDLVANHAISAFAAPQAARHRLLKREISRYKKVKKKKKII